MVGIQAWLAALAVAMAVAAAPSARSAEEKVLNVYNWSDYIADDTLAAFTARTGIKVNYDVYDSNEILDAKLLAGHSGYDLVFPTATPWFARQIKAGAYRRLDRSKIANWRRVDPKVLDRLKVADPANAYGLPYMMAGTGIGYNIALVTKAMPDVPIGSLAMVLDPGTLAKLQGCGVTVLDTVEEIFPAALAFAGRDPVSMAPADVERSIKVLTAARPFWRYTHSSTYINDLANGAICVAMGYAGDLVQARSRAREAKRGVGIGIFLPKEGTTFNIDVMAIPKDAPHPENAERFIDFILDPQIIARITNKIGYANAVPDSRPYVRPDLLADPAVNPSANVKLHMLPLVPDAFERARNRAWNRIKARR
jgi:putrescine transport system substrate-binding protein